MAGGGAGGSGGGTASGGGAGQSDAARVTAWCQKTLTPQCSAWFTSQAQCEDAMKRTQTTLCEAKWVAETDCLASVSASDWACDATGEPRLATTACRDEYLFGSYCRVSMANAKCNAGACQYDTDCPSGMGCNDKTLHCFQKTASCPGLPCKYDTDCSSGFKCNGALEQCVKA